MWKWAASKALGGILKKWALPVLFAALVAGLGYSHYLAWDTGAKMERSEWQQRLITAQETARKRQAELADELEREQGQRRTVTETKIRYVDRAPDPTGCLRVDVIDDRMLESLGGLPDDIR